MEGTTDADYNLAKRVWKNSKIKNLREYNNLYFKSDTLLLADVFEIFKNKFIEIYEPTHFLSSPGLAWQDCLKKTEIKY